MKRPRFTSKFIRSAALLLAGSLLSPAVASAADELCASCSYQVSASGSFNHHKDRPNAAIEGAGDDAAAFREDVSGTNVTVTSAHLPAG